MKKIFSLNLSNLINAKHFTFMEFTAKAITLFAIIGEKFVDAVALFLEAFGFENEVYLKYDRKQYTARINECESERDRQVRILRDAVKTAMMMPAEAIRSAATEVMNVIELYGGVKIPSLAMDAETGVLTNLIEDLEQKYQTQVTTLNIGSLVVSLKEVNERFKELLRERTQTDSEIGKAAMEEARRQTDATYRVLISMVNDQYFIKKDPALESFIDYMNVEINRYRIGLGQGVGNPNWGNGDEEDNSETDTPPTTGEGGGTTDDTDDDYGFDEDLK